MARAPYTSHQPPKAVASRLILRRTSFNVLMLRAVPRATSWTCGPKASTCPSSRPLEDLARGSASSRNREEEPVKEPVPHPNRGPRRLNEPPSSGVITPDAFDFNRFISRDYGSAASRGGAGAARRGPRGHQITEARLREAGAGAACCRNRNGQLTSYSASALPLVLAWNWI